MTVKLKSSTIGTLTVLDYADSHPEFRFDHTIVCAESDEREHVVVSEHILSDIDKECIEKGLIGWHNLPNGWKRLVDECDCTPAWVCMKDERCLFITK